MAHRIKDSLNQRFSWMWDKNIEKPFMWTAWSKLYRKWHQHCSARWVHHRSFSLSCPHVSTRAAAASSPPNAWPHPTDAIMAPHAPTAEAQSLATPCDGKGYPFSCWSAQIVQIPVLQANSYWQRKWEGVFSYIMSLSKCLWINSTAVGSTGGSKTLMNILKKTLVYWQRWIGQKPRLHWYNNCTL